GDQVRVVAAAINGFTHARGRDSGFPHGSILPCTGHLFHTRTGRFPVEGGPTGRSDQRRRRGPTSGRGPVTGRRTARAPSTTAPDAPTRTGSRSIRATSGRA